MNLKEMRLERFLTVREVAQRSGKCESQIRAWERGEVRPSLRSFRALAEAYGVEPKVILDAWEAGR